MSYDIYGNHLRPGYCEVHPDIPETYPCSVCCGFYKSDHIQPKLTVRDLCANMGHPYFGDDERGPRCYCGHNREFTTPSGDNGGGE